MKKILVTGATGQIGPELVLALRERYGIENVVAGYHSKEPPEELKAGPYTKVDVSSRNDIDMAIKQFGITHIFHLSAILSGTAQKNPQLAYKVNFKGTVNVLESALEHGVQQVVYPSSIAAFGPEAPKNTPNDTVQRPRTIYGQTKVIGEDLGDMFSEYLGLDVRGVRFPGIISWKEKPPEPPNGTTDYAVLIFYHALTEGKYECYLKPDTRLPMMYMSDAINALIQLSEADRDRLKHHADFNVSGGKTMNLTPAELAAAIRKVIPSFVITYDATSKFHEDRQSIADSWPSSLDDSIAREEWGWQPSYNLETMTEDMIQNLRRKLGIMKDITVEQHAL